MLWFLYAWGPVLVRNRLLQNHCRGALSELMLISIDTDTDSAQDVKRPIQIESEPEPK